MKAAVVFGGSGFLGSHVADELVKAGYQVTIFDMVHSPYLSEGQHMIVGDIMDKDAVDYAVRDADVVYNFAGIVDIEQSVREPVKTMNINVMGNMNVLQACRKMGVKRFVFASTLYVYSREGGFYSISKKACEQIIESYQKEFGLNYTILRYGSLYGQRANEFNWIEKILKQAITEGRITRGGDGSELREYINVKDAAKYSVEVLAKEFENEHVIISGQQQMKVKDVMEMVKEIMGGKVELEFLPAGIKSHYNITPYSFSPKIAKKYIGKSYYDFGNGVLQCLEEIYAKSDHI